MHLNKLTALLLATTAVALISCNHGGNAQSSTTPTPNLPASTHKSSTNSTEAADENDWAKLIVVNTSGMEFSKCNITIRAVPNAISTYMNNLKDTASFEISTEGSNNIGIDQFQNLTLTCKSIDGINYELELLRSQIYVDSLYTYFPGANSLSRLMIGGLIDESSNLSLDFSSKHLGTAAWYTNGSSLKFINKGPDDSLQGCSNISYTNYQDAENNTNTRIQAACPTKVSGIGSSTVSTLNYTQFCEAKAGETNIQRNGTLGYNDYGVMGCKIYKKSIPSGNYIDSCKDLQYVGSTLKAYCQGPKTSSNPYGWIYSQLDYTSCPANDTVNNLDGKLSCANRLALPDDYPQGSYQKYCDNIQFIPGEWGGLEADCIINYDNGEKETKNTKSIRYGHFWAHQGIIFANDSEEFCSIGSTVSFDPNNPEAWVYGYNNNGLLCDYNGGL